MTVDYLLFPQIEVDGRTVGGFVYENQNKEYLFPLNGLQGRVVKIVKTNEYLTICEVIVMGKSLTNYMLSVSWKHSIVDHFHGGSMKGEIYESG